MKNKILLMFSILKLCVASKPIWHSYQHDVNHQNREELQIGSIAVNNHIKLDYQVIKWKSLRTDKTCYVAGLMEKNIAIAPIEVNSDRDKFFAESYMIELEEKPIDISLFQHWNATQHKSDVIAIVATEKPELLWFRIEKNSHSLFWSWPLKRNVSHINVFQIEHDYQLLLITNYLQQTTGDIYEFEFANQPNFWLWQKIRLLDPSKSSTAIATGPNNYLAIPQKSFKSLLLFKLINRRFIPYKNLTSNGIDDVVSFKMGHKAFLAINGLRAGIYRFKKNELVREVILDSNLDNVNYWLPIPLTSYKYDGILVAQRSLDHGNHKSYTIEVITYNGEKFAKHEDIPCSYFGENISGLSCLPGDESQNGILGATSIVLNDVVGLLIPRENSFSELFIMRISMKKTENPILTQVEKFVKKRQYLNDLIESQTQQHAEIVANPQVIDLKQRKAQLEKITQDINMMKKQITSASNSMHYMTLIFNGLVEVEDGGKFEKIHLDEIRNEKANDVFKDIVLKNTESAILSSKIFTNLIVKDLVFEQVNRINASDLLFSSENITIKTHFRLQMPLIVFEHLNVDTVNNQVFENEVIDLESPVDKLIFANIEVFGNVIIAKLNNFSVSVKPEDQKFDIENMEFDEFYIAYNIKVVSLNGENFKNLLEKLCLKNINNNILEAVKVNGDITVKDNALTNFLNNLRFPLEFVFTDNSFPNITGVKKFTNSLTTSEVNCEGTVDDINTSKIITLTSDQNVIGTTTFKNLEVTERLNIVGKVIGKHVAKFVPNPTLLEKTFIGSNVHFHELEVKGSIILSDYFNGNKFSSILSDVVYVDEEKLDIEAMKQFPEGFTIRKDLFVTSNTINDINLEFIVTKHTEQILNITRLIGVINFDIIETDVLYNSIDIRQLDDKVVKLEGEQYVSSTLIFENGIDASLLQIINTINGLTEDEFFYTTRNQYFAVSIDLNGLRFENITVERNIIGDIDSFDLVNFERKRMSTIKDQLIEANYTINQSSMGYMVSVQLNNIDSTEFTKDFFERKLKTKLLEGKFVVKNLHGNTSLEIEKINKKIAVNLKGSFWIYDVKKYNMTNLTFNDDVYFDTIKIEKLSGVNFSRYYNNVIFKNETSVKLRGRKTFLQGITVKKLIETEQLNYVTISNILTKQGSQVISDLVTIQGDVFFGNNLTVSSDINNIAVTLITNNYQFFDDHYKINGDILFNRFPYIHNLHIKGYINDKAVQELIDAIIFEYSDFKLNGQTIFKNDVDIGGNIRVIGKTNNIDLPGFVSKMVMITNDIDVKAPVRFEQPTTVENSFTLLNNLKTKNLNCIALESWIEKAIFVNRGYMEGNYKFEEVEIIDSLHTEYINDVDINTLIRLRTQQNISELTFEEISSLNNILVENSTNCYNLPYEFSNAVMTNTDQDIDSEIEFLGNVYIEGDMELMRSINGIDTNKIVTTNTNQNLKAIYNFQSKIVLEKKMIVYGLVNGINVTKWLSEGVRVSALRIQNITDDWLLRENLIFENDVLGNGLINGLNLQKFQQEVEHKRNYKHTVEKGFIDDYTNICKDLSYMYDKLKNQIYKFNYLENFDMLSFNNQVQYVHNFYYHNQFCLLISEEERCETHLFVFNSHFRFKKSVTLGSISQIISVSVYDSIYFVVRNQPFQSTCSVQGTNLWQLIDDNFIHLLNMENQDILQESTIPGTFYGISGYLITEFKISLDVEPVLRKYRRWQVKEENMAFVPRGLGTGLAIRTGKKLIILNRDEPITDDYNFDTEKIILGSFSEELNMYLPGRKDSGLTVIKVGMKNSKRNLLAVAGHEETSVKGSLDFIKIYEDVVAGKVFHKIPTYKPSSLIALELNNGETLLAFMEDESVFQVYEYKGVEGFKHKLSAKMEGSRLFPLLLRKNERKIIGLINKNRISFIEAVMLGNQIEANLRCSL